MYQGCVCDSVGPEPNPPAYTLSLNSTPKPCAPKVKAAYDNLGMGAWTKIDKKIACNREGGEEDVDVGRRGGEREGGMEEIASHHHRQCKHYWCPVWGCIAHSFRYVLVVDI